MLYEPKAIISEGFGTGELLLTVLSTVASALLMLSYLTDLSSW